MHLENRPATVRVGTSPYWPQSFGGKALLFDGSLVDNELATSMALVRRLVELGRATRAESGVKTRQPLQRAMVAAAGWGELPEELRAQVADELNVLQVESLSESAGGLTDIHAKGSFRALGRSFGNRTPLVAAAIQSADPRSLADDLAEHGRATVVVEGLPVEVTPDQVVITETPRQGWAVATAAGETVALDLAITPELRRAGLARDVVRAIQEARKGAALDVSDRIVLTWTADGEVAEALREHSATVADEVLATRFDESSGGQLEAQTGDTRHRDAETGLEFWFRRSAG